MSTEINTTIVVQVTCKVNVSGEFDSAKQLKQEASYRALTAIDAALATAGSNTQITTEGARALVNDEIVEGWFQA